MICGCDISGFGIVCALGNNRDEVSANICRNVQNFVSAREIHPDAMDLPFFPAPLCNRFHSARDTLELARIAAAEAIGMAGWEDLTDCAIVIGTTSGTALHFLDSYKAGYPGDDARDYLSSNPSMALSHDFGATGQTITLSNACTSGTDALGLALDLIESGQTEKVICGGSDAFSLVAHTGFARLQLYDKDVCKPFDRTRKGLNLGEGAAFLCLEKQSAKPFGVLRGYASHCDAWHLTAPHPDGLGLRMAIKEALERAGKTSSDIAFVNAHATATIENDKAEAKIVKDIFHDVPVWASKGLTGHTLGAAGAIEAVLSLIALRKGKVPASVGFRKADEEIGFKPTITSIPIDKKFAISISLGFGGGNSAIVLGSA